MGVLISSKIHKSTGNLINALQSLLPHPLSLSPSSSLAYHFRFIFPITFFLFRQTFFILFWPCLTNSLSVTFSCSISSSITSSSRTVLPSSLWFWAGKPTRTWLQRGWHHFTHQQDWWQLVRGDSERENGHFPQQLCSSARPSWSALNQTKPKKSYYYHQETHMWLKLWEEVDRSSEKWKNWAPKITTTTS